MGWGARTTASINRFSISRWRAPVLRQVTTRGPPLGRPLRSEASAARLSSNTAIAGMLVGGTTERRYRGRLGLVSVVLRPRVLHFYRSLVPSFRRSARPSPPHRYPSPHHLSGPLEHAPRIIVAQGLQRLRQRSPLAGGDPLIYLGTDLALWALEQKKVAVFVNMAAAEAEVPVDHPDGSLQHELMEPGFLRSFPQSSLRRGLVTFEVSLGETPVVVGIANQQVLWSLPRNPAEHDASGAHLQLGATFTHQQTEILRYFLGSASMALISCRNCTTVFVVSRYKEESLVSSPIVP